MIASTRKKYPVHTECSKYIEKYAYKKCDSLRQIVKYINEDSIRKEFNEAHTAARQAVNSATSLHVQRGIATDKNSPKKFWSRLKRIMPGKRDCVTTNDNNIVLTDPFWLTLQSNKAMANHANSYFTTIGSLLASSITTDKSVSPTLPACVISFRLKIT